MRVHHLLLAVLAVFLPATLCAQESYCTLEDAWWGNPNGTFNDIGIPALLDSLIAPGEPLVLGIAGRSVSFHDGSEHCVLDGLPAGGRPAAFADSLGDAIVDTNCVLPDLFPANKKGKFRNQLVGETVALSLNVRFDPALLSVPVSPVMYTVQALPGDDGLYGTADDSLCAHCDTMTVRMPERVMAALVDSMLIDPTVSDVLAFANTTLGGGETYGAGPKDAWHAVKGINRAFKRCRFLVVEEPDTMAPVVLTPTDRGGSRSFTESESGLALSIDGEAGSRSVLHLTVSEPSSVRIVAYNVAGRKVATLADRSVGTGGMTVEFLPGRALPSGVYLIRADAIGAASGRTSVRTAKVVIVR